MFSWVYLIFFHGRKNILEDNFFWTSNIIFENEVSESNNTKIEDNICVIIPARNEENYILSTLKSIGDQNINNLSIIVVDDRSTDKTNLLVSEFRRKNKNVSILTGKKLPKGWVGKVWALKQGVDEAKKKKIDYYIFIDADIELRKKTISNVINFLKVRDLAMVSLMAKLNCKSFWEKTLIPPFIFFFQKIYPFNLANNPKSKLAAAAGGFITCKAVLFRNENIYEKIKNKVIDDCNIAKIIKEKGGIWIGLTGLVTSNRGYTKLTSIWKMVSRTAFEQLSYSKTLVLISILGMFVLYLSPLIGIVTAIIMNLTNLLLLNLLIFISILLIFFTTFKFYNLGIIYVFFVPFSSFLYMLMTISSAYSHYKSGNIWKGRSY
jgi:hopene-associated glycosyltransferase HpnB